MEPERGESSVVHSAVEPALASSQKIQAHISQRLSLYFLCIYTVAHFLCLFTLAGRQPFPPQGLIPLVCRVVVIIRSPGPTWSLGTLQRLVSAVPNSLFCTLDQTWTGSCNAPASSFSLPSPPSLPLSSGLPSQCPGAGDSSHAGEAIFFHFLSASSSRS